MGSCFYSINKDFQFYDERESCSRRARSCGVPSTDSSSLEMVRHATNVRHEDFLYSPSPPYGCDLSLNYAKLQY